MAWYGPSPRPPVPLQLPLQLLSLSTLLLPLPPLLSLLPLSTLPLPLPPPLPPPPQPPLTLTLTLLSQVLWPDVLEAPKQALMGVSGMPMPTPLHSSHSAEVRSVCVAAQQRLAISGGMDGCAALAAARARRPASHAGPPQPRRGVVAGRGRAYGGLEQAVDGGRRVSHQPRGAAPKYAPAARRPRPCCPPTHYRAASPHELLISFLPPKGPQTLVLYDMVRTPGPRGMPTCLYPPAGSPPAVVSCSGVGPRPHACYAAMLTAPPRTSCLPFLRTVRGAAAPRARCIRLMGPWVLAPAGCCGVGCCRRLCVLRLHIQPAARVGRTLCKGAVGPCCSTELGSAQQVGADGAVAAHGATAVHAERGQKRGTARVRYCVTAARRRARSRPAGAATPARSVSVVVGHSQRTKVHAACTTLHCHDTRGTDNTLIVRACCQLSRWRTRNVPDAATLLLALALGHHGHAHGAQLAQQ